MGSVSGPSEMADHDGLVASSVEASDDDPGDSSKDQWVSSQHSQSDQAGIAADATASLPISPEVSATMQKRRRVTRACDECRRKKIKCDGKQPCTHCTVYSYGQ